MKVHYWLNHPRALVNRIKALGYDLIHPGRPFLAPAAIDFLERELPREGIGIEWGSGRSTAWLARHLRHLTSVEHNADWHARVSQQLRDLKIDNVDYRFVPLDHADTVPTVPVYAVTPRYVAVADAFPDAHFDFAEVDGHYRQACAIAIAPKIKPGGLLLIDDTDWLPRDQWHVPAEWKLIHESVKVNTTTSIWRKPG